MARRTRPAKWHTQNFLRDPALAQTLVDRAGLTDTDLVYEIGAGSGTITAALADRCRAVIANEIDRSLCEELRSRFAGRANVEVRCGDFLAERLPTDPYKAFANPPFDITAEIVARLVSASRPPDDAFLVVQREAAARYCGGPNETLVGLLLKPFFAPLLFHRFHQEDFEPKPSVEAVMLRLRKRGPPLVAPDDAQPYRDLVVATFTAWKPTIGAALAGHFGPRAARRLLAAADLNPALRPAQVPLEEWLRLYAEFARMPDALRGRVAGAEARLRRQQGHLHKEHRSRAPRDALEPQLQIATVPNLGRTSDRWSRWYVPIVAAANRSTELRDVRAVMRHHELRGVSHIALRPARLLTAMTATRREIQRATFIRASAEQVYDLIATADGLDRWFTVGATLDPWPGGQLVYRWKDWGPGRVNTESHGTVREARAAPVRLRLGRR